MLSTRAPANTTLGTSRLKPSDRPRAVAQTASRTPERTRTSQYTWNSWNAVLSLSGYGVLVRESGSRTRSKGVTPGGGRWPGSVRERSGRACAPGPRGPGGTRRSKELQRRRRSAHAGGPLAQIDRGAQPEPHGPPAGGAGVQQRGDRRGEWPLADQAVEHRGVLTADPPGGG